MWLGELYRKEMSDGFQMKKDISLIIPAYNEEDQLEEVLKKSKNYAAEIIVIDDGSDDSTYQIATKYTDKVIKNSTNKGKGYSINRGINFASKQFIVLMDGDGQQNPGEIPELVYPLLNEKYDMVIGSRNFKSVPFLNSIANKILNTTFQMIFKIKIKDSLSGFRAIKTESIRRLIIKSQRYEIEVEMLIRAWEAGLKIKEHPISITYHPKRKKIPISECMGIFTSLIYEKIKLI